MNGPTDDSLGELRAAGDPVAEGFVHQILRQSGCSASELLAFLRMPADDRPMWLNDLLEEIVQRGPTLPSWADEELIKVGQRFFNNWDLAICTALFTASLPSTYAGAQGVTVLARASQLARPGTVAQRIGETGQMLLDITEPGALERGEAGYRRIMEVRLLHATVRQYLLAGNAPGGEWPMADGVPVNQEDLFATLTTFTVIVFRALSRMGIEVPPSTQEAYLHLWSVVGELLGIDEAELLRSPGAAGRLTTHLLGLIQGPSADGAFLMSILLDEMEFAMPLGWLRVPRTLVRFLVGNRVADMLDVPSAAWWSPLLPFSATLNGRLNRNTFVRRINIFPSRVLGRRIVQYWIDKHWRDERRPFSISAERCSRWRIADNHTKVARLRRQLRGRRQRLREAHARVPRHSSSANLGR